MSRGFGLLSAGFLLLVMLLAAAGPVGAQEELPSDDEVNRIAKQLYCPVCENVPLDVCPTKACEQWRETIRQKLAEGWSEEQIKQFFVDQYGARVLATPPPSGFNRLVYILPPLAFLAGIYMLLRAFRSWRRPAPAGEPLAAAEDEVPADPYVARLEEELRRMEEE
jgi:cytochrome c-type biogenesis protein CcmH